MTTLNFDFDPDEIVQQPGHGGPLSLRSAIARLPTGPVAAITMLNRDNGKQPPFFDAKRVEELRELFRKQQEG
jgi:hypothetical protein